jgi:hypothetical protein
MIPLFIGLTLVNLLGLGTAAALGYAAKAGHPVGPWHVLSGALATLTCCAVHCVVFTYFAATSKWVRHAIEVKGLDPLYDVINLHSYAQVEGWPTWRRSYPEDPAIPYLKDIRDVIAWRDANARGKQVWLTEFGRPSCDDNVQIQELNNVMDVFNQWASTKWTKTFWYVMHSGSGGSCDFSLIHDNWTRRGSFYRYRDLIEMFTGGGGGGGGAASFYEHLDFAGGSFERAEDMPFVGWDWNDQITSIRVPSGKTVIIYEHSDYGGSSLTLTGDATDLRQFPGPGADGTWNDAVSSIKVF